MNPALSLLFICLVSPIIAQSESDGESAIISFSDDEETACLEIIRQGVYDYVSMHTSTAQSYSDFVSYCNDYSSSYQSTESHSSSSGGWFSSSSSSWSQTIKSGVYDLMCRKSSHSASSASAVSIANKFVDPYVLTAYQECLNQTNVGILVQTTLREPDQGQVTIQMRYVPPLDGQVYLAIDDIYVSPPGAWECSGPLADAALSNGAISTQSIGMSCTRNISDEPFIYQGQSIYAGTSSIVIFTSLGSVSRDFNPIYSGDLADWVQTNKTFTPGMQALGAQLASIQAQMASLRSSINSRIPGSCNIPMYSWTLTGTTKRQLSSTKPSSPETWVNSGLSFYACS